MNAANINFCFYSYPDFDDCDAEDFWVEQQQCDFSTLSLKHDSKCDLFLYTSPNNENCGGSESCFIIAAINIKTTQSEPFQKTQHFNCN